MFLRAVNRFQHLVDHLRIPIPEEELRPLRLKVRFELLVPPRQLSPLHFFHSILLVGPPSAPFVFACWHSKPRFWLLLPVVFAPSLLDTPAPLFRPLHLHHRLLKR